MKFKKFKMGLISMEITWKLEYYCKGVMVQSLVSLCQVLIHSVHLNLNEEVEDFYLFIYLLLLLFFNGKKEELGERKK